MAIKISGNTVIDDSRNFCNIGTATATCFVGDGSAITGIGPDRIFKPGNQSPADAATDVEFEPTLTGTCFVSTVGSSHCCTCFQVSECSDFSTCNSFTCEIAGGCTSITVPDGCLNINTQHFFRLRYEDEDGCCSEFSDTTCFTTAPLPSTLGESICGGFYMGTICAAGSCYYLIMAPNATGCAYCQYRVPRANSGEGDERCDGYGNTYDHLANATHPAGNWTATRSIGGFSDWYLPASCELQAIYNNIACTPVGEGWTGDRGYWLSTANVPNTDNGLILYMAAGRDSPGRLTDSDKENCRYIRAIRRVPF